MNRPGENCLFRGSLAVTTLLIVLVALAFVPPQTVGGIRFRRANILADLLAFDDAPAAEELLDLADAGDIPAIDLDSVADIAATGIRPQAAQLVYDWHPLPAVETAPERTARLDSLLKSPKLIPVEEFGDGAMEAFYDTLLHARRPVRIAFLGDSFVEGDILTADLREQLQLSYGGGGAGFAPMASPLTAYRRTVKTQSKGWTAYNIMQHKNTPEALRNSFYVSGWLCAAGAGAATTWSSTDFREQLRTCSEAHIFFVSPSESRVEVTLNDTLRQSFTIAASPAVRELSVGVPQLQSCSFRVIEGGSGFIGYGAVFDAGSGVSVDNYSIRSNNGRALFWTNPSVDAQFHARLHYDLVILQYGLNIMQQGVRRYDRYGEQLDQMIAFVRECFPGAAVLLLGVSDRSVKGENGFEPMDAVPWMTECQRAAARRAGAAFWPTNEAMESWGGMAAFVANGWAGKDYTHINYNGGRRIAWSLADAMHAGVRRAAERAVLEQLQQAAAENVLGEWQYRQLDEQLLPAIVPVELGSDHK